MLANDGPRADGEGNGTGRSLGGSSRARADTGDLGPAETLRPAPSLSGFPASPRKAQTTLKWDKVTLQDMQGGGDHTTSSRKGHFPNDGGAWRGGGPGGLGGGEAHRPQGETEGLTHLYGPRTLSSVPTQPLLSQPTAKKTPGFEISM